MFVLFISNIIDKYYKTLPLRSLRNLIRKQHEPQRPRKTGKEVPDRLVHCNDLKESNNILSVMTDSHGRK